MSFVELEVRPDKIVILTLNDPDHLNAMGNTMAQDFAARLKELDDHAPRVVILTGAGRAFSAGGDRQMLEEKMRQSARQNESEMIAFYNSFLDILELNVPLIACIQGHAVGAAFCLACACDLRVAESNAVMSTPFLHMGLFPGMGATMFMPQALGNLGSELLLTGRPMRAEEALRIGFLCRLTESGKGLETALELAQQLLRGAPNVTRQLLEVLRPSRRDRLVFLEREAKLQAQSYLEEEFRAGFEAAKTRPPAPEPAAVAPRRGKGTSPFR